MFRLFLLIILFYFIYKGVKVFIKYFSAEMKRAPHVQGNKSGESKYKNVEEVEFREIKNDSKNTKE